MKTKVFLLLAGLGIIFSTGCEDNWWYQVPDEAEDFVDSFIEDAENNGYDLNIEASGLIIEFQDICEPVRSELYYEDPLRLIINENVWQNLNTNDRQMLIYKDLAQGYLNRLNKDDLFENGEFASIMRTEKDTTQFTHINFFGLRKNYYIHEVFNPMAEAPWWATYKQDYDSLAFDKTEVLFSDNTDQPVEMLSNTDNLDISYLNSELLIQNKTDNAAQVFWADVLPKDGDFELDCIMKIDISSVGQCSGIIWGADNTYDWYMCSYNPDGKAIMYNHAENHTYCGFQGRSLNTVYQNTYNKISVRKQGAFVYFFINEEFVYFTDIHKLYGNDAGFHVGANSRIIINRLELKTNES